MKEHAKVKHLQHALDGEDGREPVIEQAQLLVSEQEKYLKDVDFDQGNGDYDDGNGEPFTVLLDGVF